MFLLALLFLPNLSLAQTIQGRTDSQYSNVTVFCYVRRNVHNDSVLHGDLEECQPQGVHCELGENLIANHSALRCAHATSNFENSCTFRSFVRTTPCPPGEERCFGAKIHCPIFRLAHDEVLEPSNSTALQEEFVQYPFENYENDTATSMIPDVTLNPNLSLMESSNSSTLSLYEELLQFPSEDYENETLHQTTEVPVNPKLSSDEKSLNTLLLCLGVFLLVIFVLGVVLLAAFLRRRRSKVAHISSRQ